MISISTMSTMFTMFTMRRYVRAARRYVRAARRYMRASRRYMRASRRHLRACGPGRGSLRPVAAALGVLLVPGAVGPLGAQEPEPPTPDLAEADTLPVDSAVRIGELDNGLRYYVRRNARPENRAELRLVVNAGSVLETEEQRGLAHVVEHMAFNGTERFPRQELVDYLERVGMEFGPHVNAYTSFDETVYMLTVPTDTAGVVETAFDILEQWAGAVAFDPEEVDKERGVVVEEWRLGLGAQQRLREEQLPVLFHGSRYAERLPIGTRESLESFGREDLTAFYERWYRPDLMAVIAVGDFEPERIESLIRERFAGLVAPAEPAERVAYEVPDHDSTLYAVATDPEVTNTSVQVYHKRPLRPFETVEEYRARILESLYSSLMNRRLFEIAQRPDAPFLFAGTGQGSFVRTKETGVLVSAAPEGGAAAALEALVRESKRVREHGFTETELEREKGALLRQLEQAYDEREKQESGAYASEYVRHFLQAEPIPGIEAEYALHARFMPEIGLGEVNALADDWLGQENRVVLVSAPEPAEAGPAGADPAAEADPAAVPTEAEMRAALERAEGAEVAAYEDAATDVPLVAEAPEPGRVVAEDSLPEIDVTIWELSNGVRVILKPTDFKDDEVLLQAWSPGGTSLIGSTEEWERVFAADAAVSQGGVGPHDLVGLQKALAGKAVRVSPGIGSLTEGMQGRASPKDLETMFQLVWLWFTDPNRDEDAFRAFQQQVSGLLQNRAANPMAAFQDTVTITMAGHHPRARPPTPELFAGLDLDASFEFYRERYADASDFAFVLVGAFTPEEVRPLVTRWLGSLPDLGREESWRDLGMDPPEGVVEKVVRAGMEPQSRTRIAFTGSFEFTPRNREAMRALASALQIRLREILREDLGGTYSVSVNANYEKFPDPAYDIRISFGSDPDRADELTEVVWREVESFRTEGPTAEEVQKVREQARRQKEESLRENAWWAANLMFRDQTGESMTELAGFEHIEAIDAEMIREAAAAWLDPDRHALFRLLPEAAAAEKPDAETPDAAVPPDPARTPSAARPPEATRPPGGEPPESG